MTKKIKDYDIKIDEDSKSEVDDDMQALTLKVARQIYAKEDEIFVNEIWENTNYCGTYKLASKEELTRFFEKSIKTNNRIKELKVEIDNVFDEIDRLADWEVKMRVINELRYIQQELEKLFLENDE